MPLYEYICLDCENTFETLVLSAEDEPACPACGSTRLEKAMSAFAGLNLSTGCSGSRGFS
ncbi:MAG: zinc ribbon domain-containing protein [Thermodesulfobacteriota bacterium]